MRIRSLLGLWIGKLIKRGLRVIGRTGTSLPGYVAGIVSPMLLTDLLLQLDSCVIVTGTNGKTTTTALLYAFLNQKDSWLTNQGGANLQQGLLAAMMNATNGMGHLLVKKAVLEVDEATLPKITRFLQPTVIVVTNVLRDQLDRYGEVDQTLQLLKQGTRYPGSILVLNGDDPLAMSLGIDRPELTFYYGVGEEPDVVSDRADVRDGAFCLLCGKELEYDYFIYGQVGSYRCPSGHFERPSPNFGGYFHRKASHLLIQENDRGLNNEFGILSPLKGLFNQYNLLAAVSAARLLGVSPEALQNGIQHFIAPIGRFEVFSGVTERILALIKNPTGANSVLRALEEDERDKAVCFAINDDDADGRDVSWLWDINLEEFLPRSRSQIWYCAGTRGLDMALRLAYAGVCRENIRIVDELSELISVTDSGSMPVYVLSTYTALYPLSRILREGAVS